MEVIRVLNNNAVLCADRSGGQAILLGRGLGFGRCLGDEIPESDAEQIFTPSSTHPLANLTALVAETPLKVLTLARDVVTNNISELVPASSQERLILGLADHIAFAIEHAQQEGSPHPLHWEVSTLYPREYAAGQAALGAIQAACGVALHEDEAVAIAMHIITAQYAGGSMSQAEQHTRRISQMVSFVAERLSLELPLHSPTVARFVTHLRYLLARIAAPTAHRDPPLHSMLHALEKDDPESVSIARDMAQSLQLTNDNEVTYIALHIARLKASLV